MLLRLTPPPHVHSPQTTRVRMRNVLIALLPCAVAGAGYFGPAALALMLVSTASAVLFEALWQKLTGGKVQTGDLSAAVTGLILAMNLPPRAPWWMAVTGSAFAVVIVKGLFGGLGENRINPALAARALLLVSWPRYMTAWAAPGGWRAAADAVSAATPLADPSGYTTWQLFIGRVPGCVGEGCKLAILLGLAWLLVTGTISWRIPAAMMASLFAFSRVFGESPVAAALSGGALFGAVFMATDDVTSPVDPVAQWVYAAGAGLLVAVLRRFARSPEGATYAILMMNAVAPVLDRGFRRRVYGYGWKSGIF